MAHIQDNLVEELHSVTQEHEGNNVPVDLVAQSSQINRIDAFGVAMFVQELPGGIDIGDTSSGREKSSGGIIVA